MITRTQDKQKLKVIIKLSDNETRASHVKVNIAFIYETIWNKHIRHDFELTLISVGRFQKT